MKKTVTKVLSILLALACLHGIVMSALSLVELKAVKEGWSASEAEQADSLDKLSAAIEQYRANSPVVPDSSDEQEDANSDNSDDKPVSGDETGGMPSDANQSMAEEDKELHIINSEALSKEEPNKNYSDADKAQIDKWWAAYNDANDAVTKAKAEFDAAAEALQQSKPAYDDAKEALDAAKAEKSAADSALASMSASYESAQAEMNAIGSIYSSAYPTYQKYLTYKALYDQDIANGLTISVWEKPMNEQYAWLMILTGNMPMDDIVVRYNAANATISGYESAQARADSAKTALDNAQAKYDDALPQYTKDKEAYDTARVVLASSLSKRSAAQLKYEEAVKKANEALQSGSSAPTENVPQDLPNIDVKDNSAEEITGALDTLLTADTYTNSKGTEVLPSINERVGEGFSYLDINENGEVVLNADKALLVAESAKNYLSDSAAAAAREFANLSATSAIELVICIIGLIAAVMGLLGKTKLSGIVAIVTAGSAVFAIIAMSINSGHEYPFTVASGSAAASNILTGLVILIAAAVIHAIGAFVYSYMSTKKVSD